MNETRKTGEHRFVDCGGAPRCVTCGADEDDAYVGGEPCSYQASKSISLATAQIFFENASAVILHDYEMRLIYPDLNLNEDGGEWLLFNWNDDGADCLLAFDKNCNPRVENGVLILTNTDNNDCRITLLVTSEL